MWKRCPRGEAADSRGRLLLGRRDYAEPAISITRGLIEDGEKHLFGDRLIETGCPVHILQGLQDPTCRGACGGLVVAARPATTWC